MSNLSLQDQIWNRACIGAGGATPAVGDQALASVLLAHGLAMNGGVTHALESLSRADILAAVAGFEFFGLTDAARVFQQVPGDSGEAENRLNQLYFAAVPTDEALAHAFGLKLASTPEAFAPLSNGAHA